MLENRFLEAPPVARPLSTNTPREIAAGPRPHVVFLRRKNPAIPGGIQRLSGRLVDGLSPSFDIEQISWFGPEWGVPVYFPFFYLKSVRNGARLVHCDDAVTSLVGAKIKRRSGKLVVANVHGLDIILPIPWYQEKLRRSLGMLDKVICISHATAAEAKRRGVTPDKIEIIPCMAESPMTPIPKNEELYDSILNDTGIDLRGKKVLLSLGRPVKRKGFDRFITEVFPHLPEDFVYLVAGPKITTPLWIESLRPALSVSLYHNLLLAAGAFGMHQDLLRLSNHPRVYYLNGVSDALKEQLLAASDLFIMPNRTVEGDMEGFGLVALEAAIRGIPVVAAGIEGITDAVIDGQNGYCVSEGDTAGMARTIRELLGDPEGLKALGLKAREFTEETFSPAIISKKYERLFGELLESSGEKSRPRPPIGAQE